MEESQRQNLVMAFNNVLRTSALVGVVDVQRAALGFSALLDQTPEGAPIALGPIYEFLLEQKGPENAVREVIVFLKSRESRFNVQMELPEKLANLTQEERDKLIVSFTQRGASSGTFAGKSIDPKAKTSSATGAEAPPANTNATANTNPKKKKNELPRQTKLAAAVGVLVVVLVIDFAYNAATAVPPPVPLTPPTDPAGLPCKEFVQAANNSVICRVPATFAKQPEAVIAAKAAVTASSARAQGLTKLFVFTLEDNRLIYSK